MEDGVAVAAGAGFVELASAAGDGDPRGCSLPIPGVEAGGIAVGATGSSPGTGKTAAVEVGVGVG